MASTSRPVSFQPSASRIESSLSVDYLTPLRRSLSPTGQGHYTLKRFSYIAELPTEDPFVPRPRSILRSRSFSMGFGFKDKEKGKEKMPEPSPTTLSPSVSLPPPPAIQNNDRPFTSHGLFSSLHRPKMKKKRSMSSLLDAAVSDSTAAGPSAPRVLRIRSSDAASSLSSASLSKGKRQTPESQRLEEYRQMQLNPYFPKPHRRYTKTLWGKRHNMKVHTLQDQVCYMQAFDPIILENDRQADLLLRRLNHLENPSFHDYTGKEPVYVLDLGCGPGHWLLEASSYWKRTLITGVDMVDILLPEARNNDQIDFMQGNFLLTPWPLPPNHFDYVRMANLSLCIPYSKWEDILAEAHRVLRVNGRLELIDDQIFFPYAPQPLSRPTSISIPKLSTAPTPAPGTFLDIHGTDDDEDDVASVNTESTLFSDGDTTSSQVSRRQSSTSTSTSDSYHGTTQLRAPVSPGADLPNTPTSIITIKPIDSSALEWNTGAAASRDMETVYRSMLHKKFGVHSQPSEFVPPIIQHVFGNSDNVKSFHLKLAPKDAHREFSRSLNDLVGTAVSEEEESVEIKKTKDRRAWFGGDPEKDEKKRSKKISKPSTPTAALSAMGISPDTSIPEGLSSKAAGRLGISKSVSRVPENVSAKAALRLGIPMSSDRPFEIPSRLPTSSPDTDSDVSPTSSLSSSPPEHTVSSPPENKRQSQDSISGLSVDSKLSAKAAHRLGISYSALGEATASAKASTRRPLSSSSTLVSSAAPPVQSPGLLVWPNKFIPFSPEELEMHVLKNVHTLIGCKPALAEYVGTFLDEEGKRVESEEGFEDALWNYECFRRRRLNWPTDMPLDWDVDSEMDASDFAVGVHTPKSGADTPVRSAALRNSMILDTPLPPPSDSIFGPPYKNDELTHVRSIRVYEAVKTSEYSLSTMRTPRSPPPNPPRP